MVKQVAKRLYLLANCKTVPKIDIMKRCNPLSAAHGLLASVASACDLRVSSCLGMEPEARIEHELHCTLPSYCARVGQVYWPDNFHK